MIKVQGLTKAYHQNKVVDDVDIEIEKGKITSFIGPNGAGKSTVLAMVSRLIETDEGNIKIDNQDITSMKSNELAKKLSILKQTNHTELKISVRQLVSFGRFPYSKGKLKKADHILSLIHISEPTRRTPISYAVFCLKKKSMPSSA